MSDSYSKVTCPKCGVNIEYPADYQLASVPCPKCSEIVPLFGEKDGAAPLRPPETPAPASVTPVGVQGNSQMKHMLTIFLAIAGLIMLAVGYSAPARARAESLGMESAKGTAAVYEAQRDQKNEAADSAAEYAETVKRMAEGKSWTPQEELVKAMQKAIKEAQKGSLKGQEQLLENMTDSLEEGSVKTRGAIQYCTGWVLIAAACIVFAVGRHENQQLPTRD
jgi:hypothetical protein